jgi:propanol-preferring alcohol dehydrogenase
VKALVIERPRQASLADVERPEPGTGEVLVRVAATGICGSGVEILDGRRPARPRARAKEDHPVRPARHDRVDAGCHEKFDVL